MRPINVFHILLRYGGTILLYTGVIVLLYFFNADLSIQSFSDRIVSSGSVINYYIDARIKIYFFSLGLFLISAVGLFFICFCLEHWLIKEDKKVLNASSYFALILIGLMIFTAQEQLPYVIYGVPIVHAIILLHSAVHSRRQHTDFTGGEYYGWLVTIGLTTISLITACGTPWLSDQARYTDLLLFGVVVSLLHVIMLFIKPQHFQITFHTIVYIAFPIMLAPLLPIIIQEAGLIQQSRQMTMIGSTQLYWVCIVLLAIWTVIRTLRVYLKHKLPSTFNLLQWYYFPCLIAGLIVLIWYQPTATISLDLFEPANPGLMIQQFFEFRALPYIQNFNAHGWSDAVWGFVYTALHGSVDYTWTQYDFFERVIELIIGYIFIALISKNPYLALVTVLTLPFIDLVFPAFFTVALVTPMIMWRTIRQQKFYWYLGLGLSLITLFFWRIDIGISAMLATVATASLWRFMHSHLRVQWSALAAGLGLAAVLTAVLFGIGFFFSQTNPIDWVRDFVHILNSNQAFGYPFIQDGVDSQFYWGYGVIPIALLILTAYLYYVVRWQKKSLPFFDISLLFLSTFTLFNFSRGLVRHNLSENLSFYLLPFGVLIIGLFIWRFSKVKIGAAATLLSVLIMGGITYVFSYQAVAFYPLSDNLSVSVIDKIHLRFTQRASNLSAAPAPDQIGRSIVPPTIADTNFTELVEFMHLNLTPEQTFFDFSNSPMLYYYAHRRSPHYTNHIILMHDRYLQDRLVEALTQFDIPVVIFSYAHPYILDDLLFNWRQYRVAEHIYENYHPYRLINNREVWIRDDWQPPHEPTHVSTSPMVFSAEEFFEEVLTEYTLDNATVYAADATTFISVFPYPQLVSANENYYVHITGTSQQIGVMRLFYKITEESLQEDAMADFSVTTGWNDLYIKLPAQDKAWTLSDLRLNIFPESQFSLETFQLVFGREPDATTSLINQAANLGYIPYLWGELGEIDYAALGTTRYDADFSASISATANQNLNSINPDNPLFLTYKPLSAAEKSMGNYVVIQARTAAAELPTTVTLKFGASDTPAGSIYFTGLADGELYTYAIRVSAMYNWYSANSTWLKLEVNQGTMIIESIAIIPAD